MVNLNRTNYDLTLKKLSLKQKIIFTWRIWFGMKVNLKVKAEEQEVIKYENQFNR